MADPSPWWDRDSYADRRPFLLARGRILSALRDWFRKRGFLEVETPALQVSPGNEIHLHAFATELTTPGGARAPLYLHTSPEFTCKKLLAAGESRIFSLSHVFRNRERGPLHHPEFTMLEWYRANEPYEALMADCAAILVEAAKAAGTLQLQWKGRTADPYAAPERLTRRRRIREIRRHRSAGDARRRRRRPRPVRCRGAQGWRPGRGRRRLVGYFQPRAGRTDRAAARARPADVARPVSAAGSGVGAARHDPRLAERFELYACGVELANGFGEITDAGEQRRRFEEAMAERQRRYGERYPIDDDFLAALAVMPPASGIALGFDRLVMLATGAPRIEQVLWARWPATTANRSH